MNCSKRLDFSINISYNEVKEISYYILKGAIIMELKQQMDNFLNQLKEDGKSDHTIKSYRTDFNRFVDFIEAYDVDGVDGVSRAIVKDFKRIIERNHKPSTSNHNLTALKRLFKYYGREDVANAIQLRKVANQNVTKWSNEADITRIFHAIETMPKWNDVRRAMIYTMTHVLIDTGVRVSELVNIRIVDVDTDERVLTVTHGKGDKLRYVPLTKQTLEIVQEWLDIHDGKSKFLFYSQKSDKMTTRNVQYLYKKISEAAGVEFTPHTARHTFGKQLANKTNRIESVATLLGHANLNTTRRYIEPSLDELRESLEAVQGEG